MSHDGGHSWRVSFNLLVHGLKDFLCSDHLHESFYGSSGASSCSTRQ